MELVLDDLTVSRQYVSGMKFTREAIRKYKNTIKSKTSTFFNETIFSEVHTKKVKGGDWGEGDVCYYYNDVNKEFKSLEEALSYKYQIIKNQ